MITKELVNQYGENKSVLRKWALKLLGGVAIEDCQYFTEKYLKGRVTGHALFDGEVMDQSVILAEPILCLGANFTICGATLAMVNEPAVAVAPWISDGFITNCIFRRAW